LGRGDKPSFFARGEMRTLFFPKSHVKRDFAWFVINTIATDLKHDVQAIVRHCTIERSIKMVAM